MRVLDKVFIGILVAIFGGIVLHAPLTVGFGTLFPSAELLIKSWKEILMLVAGLLAIIVLTRKKQWGIIRHPLILLMTGYAALHVLLIPLFQNSVTSVLAGILIDLRYILFFVLVVIAVRLYPELRRWFIGTFIVGALIVGIFALLQVFVLPPDILSHIGYNENTIVPYLTVDENTDFIRINSTLRGPNPLGAYAVIVLALLVAFWLKGNHKKVRRPMVPVTLLLVGSVVALWASYSRSALVAAFVAIGTVLALAVGKIIPKWLWVSLVVVVLAVGAGIFVAKDNSFISNVILHENEGTGAQISSNEGHVSSLEKGLDRMVHQPFGGGVGSTGSASLYGDHPLIIENQYLLIAHEVGWLGLGLFLVIFYKVMRALWQQRKDWLALGIFASGIGLALIGLLLPVWVDDTVAIIWWGLAALVIGGSDGQRSVHKTSKRTA